MDKEKITKFQERLALEKKKLLADLEGTEEAEDFGSDIDDDKSIEADEAESMANKAAIGQALRDRLSEIDAALNRIARGEYGTCARCHGEIGEGLLEKEPAAVRCASCASS